MKNAKREWLPQYRPIITYTIVSAYTAIGLGLAFQPSRFGDTPSYANLLHFAPAELWGALYLTVSALLLGWRVTRRPWVGITAHTLAMILTLWWLSAFVVRYFSDSATTVVNVVSWAVFLSLVLRSTGGIDDEEME